MATTDEPKAAADTDAEPKAPATTRVYPSPDLLPTEYVPGVPADGAEIPSRHAARLLRAGLVTTEPPAQPDKE